MGPACTYDMGQFYFLFLEQIALSRLTTYTAVSRKVVLQTGKSLWWFYGCLIEPQGVSAWLKETAQTRPFLLSRFLLLNQLEPQSSKTKLLLSIMSIDVVAYAFKLLRDNLCRNSCIRANPRTCPRFSRGCCHVA